MATVIRGRTKQQTEKQILGVGERERREEEGARKTIM